MILLQSALYVLISERLLLFSNLILKLFLKETELILETAK